MMSEDDNHVFRIEQRYRRRGGYAVHAVFYGCYLILSLIFLLDPGFWRRLMTLPNTGDIFLILVIWTVCFAAHSARFYFQEAATRSIEREMTVKTKLKRKRDRLRLTSDGELSDDILEADDRHIADQMGQS